MDELVAIRVKGNPLPFAVGVSLVSWEGIQHNGLRGRAARIIHCYGDMMCQKWNRNAPINEGFSQTRIHPLPGYEETGALAVKTITEGSDEDPDVDNGEDSKEGHGGSGDGEGCAAEAVMDGPDGGGDADAGDLISGVEAMAIGEVEQEGETVTDKDMDAALEIYLLRALYYVIKDKHLPILVSSLWALLLRYWEIQCEV